MPRISVIICAYNASKLLKTAIKSVLGQTFEDLELIIVNDGSSDSTLAVASAFALSDRRVRCVDIANGGLSNARNVGISVAKGEFVTFCDADDYIDPDALQVMYDAVTNTNADTVIVGYHHDTVLKDGSVFTVDKTPQNAVYNSVKELLPDLKSLKSQQILDTACNKLFKRSVIVENGLTMPVGELFEDTAFCLQYLSVCKKIITVDRCFYHYIQHGKSSITSSYNPRKAEFLTKRYHMLTEFCKDGDIAVKRYCNLYHLRNMYSCFADSFGSDLSAKERRTRIKTVVKSELFEFCAKNADTEGLSNKLTVFVAKTGNVTLSVIYSCLLRFVKRKCRVVFAKFK